jgi:hypothetical protein
VNHTGACLIACLKCVKERTGLAGVTGSAACPENGRDIRACAAAGNCPIGKHPARGNGGAAPPPIKVGGPGTELKKLIEAMGVGERVGCGCAKFAAEMDVWGPDECERRTEEIVAKMMAEAGKRWWGKAMLALAPGAAEAKARELVGRAIANARAAMTT